MKFESFRRLFGKQWKRKTARRERQKLRPRPEVTPALLDVELLESRELLSTLPEPNIVTRMQLSTTNGNHNTPTIAVNPINPQRLVMAYVQDGGTAKEPGNSIYIQGQYSTNSGQTWIPFSIPRNFRDATNPGSTTAAVPYSQATDPVVQWDRNNNFYLVYSEHRDDNAAGAIVLQKYNFAGFGGPTLDMTYANRFPSNNFAFTGISGNVIYSWVGDQAVTPVLAVDNNLRSFTDPTTGITTIDPYAGDAAAGIAPHVFAGYATVDIRGNNTPAGNFNPNSVKFLISSDGGLTFGTSVYANSNRFNDNGNNTGPHVASPQLVVSRGTGDGRVFPGQLTVVFDDFNSGATATPPVSRINVDRVQNGEYGQTFYLPQGLRDQPEAGDTVNPSIGRINQAIDPGSGAPHIPQETRYPLQVTVNPAVAGLTLSNIVVGMGAEITDLQDKQISLISPDNQEVILVRNRQDSAGNVTTNPNVGIQGQNMGITARHTNWQQAFTLGQSIDAVYGTFFDETAPRTITAQSGATAPYTGHFQSDLFANFGRGNGLDQYFGRTKAVIDGTWTLRIVDFRNTTFTGPIPPDFLYYFSLSITMNAAPIQSVIASSEVRGALLSPYTQITSAATPARGIGPAPTIAADNTLGSFSPNQGDLYIAYTSRQSIIGTNNQADNTDIALMVSTDGGVTWVQKGTGLFGQQHINDDLSTVDGFTDAEDATFLNNGRIAGRPQFEAQIAVDQQTGALIATWYDTRDDAARARVARYVTISLDGGNTFSPQTFMNQQSTAFDEITRQNIVVGPIPDNQSAQNLNPRTGANQNDVAFGFGDRQGLTVDGGRIFTAWSGNLNGGLDGTMALRIQGAFVTYAVGPRVVDSTMGPIQPQTVTNLNTNASVTFNNQTTADGTPILNGFVVYLDRPIDPATFDGSQVSVIYRGPNTNGNDPGTQVTGVITVIPLFDETAFLNLSANQRRAAQLQFGASKYLVSFPGQSAIGTYSYTIGNFPNANVGIRSRIRYQTATGAPINIGRVMDQSGNAITGEAPIDIWAVPNPTDKVSSYKTNPYPFFAPPFTSDTLPLIVPGPHLTDTFVNATFTPTPDQLGQTIPPTGTGGTGVAVKDTITSKLQINAGDPTAVIRNLTVNLTLTHSADADLVITLTGPNNVSVVLSQNRGGNGANFTNTIFDDAAATSIAAGAAPFTGRFKPDGALSAFIGAPLNGTWTLTIQDTRTGNIGKLTNWSLTASTVVNGIGAPQDITLAAQSTVSSIDVVFDRDMDPSSLTPAQVLRVMGPAGEISATGAIKAGFTITPNPNATDPDPNFPRTYRINFVTLGGARLNLDLSGTYTVNLGSGIRDKAGDLLDTNLNAGLDQLRTTPSAGTTTTVFAEQLFKTFNSADVPKQIGGAANTTVTSTLNVTDDLLLTGNADVTVQLDIAYIRDPDLTATLTAPNGKTITLFSNVGQGGNQQNFTNTVLDDNASTPIAQGTPPFTGHFRPSQAFATLFSSGSFHSQGTWTLTIRNSQGGVVGMLNNWSLNLRNRTVIGDSAVAGKVLDSTLTVNDDFVLSNGGITVQLDISYAHDPDLSAFLIAPNGTRIKLFSGVGGIGTQQNFTNTIFDDAQVAPDGSSVIPISQGGPPFNGRFNPQQPLGDLFLNGPIRTGGVWTLEIVDKVAGTIGTLNNWSLTLKKPRPISGLGEPVADRVTPSFRIFTMDPANPLARSDWTSVGAASINGNGNSGRVGGIAVDPSDPSGNTVYVAGASGGVWKTNNFLTNDPNGPTYIPLTDFGPTFSMNIGGISVFGRNNDPNQSVIFVVTGEGDTGTRGVGVLRSMDAGSTWTVLDSTTNVDANGNVLPLSSPQRDHAFVGSTTFKVEVDPRPTSSGDAIVYAAVSGNNGGIWRSLDSGRHWSLMRAGQATDVVLDPNSGRIDAVSNPTGNLETIFGAFRGDGVYVSPNRGQVWNQMTGTIGDPLIQDFEANFRPVPVSNPNGTPNGAKGRIVLAKPQLTGVTLADGTYTGDRVQDLLYQGWLYAFVATPNGNLDGLYLTKDVGQTWTKVRFPSRPNPFLRSGFLPTNDDVNFTDFNIFGTNNQANYDIALTVDPTNPNIVYIGGVRPNIIRIDATKLSDAHAFFLGQDKADGGALMRTTADPLQLQRWPNIAGSAIGAFPNAFQNPVMNLLRSPADPFNNSSTILVSNTDHFANTGSGTKWIDFSVGGGDAHRLLAIRDPLTGQSRVIVGNDQGIYSGVDDGTGQFDTGIGTAQTPLGSRNGNLQITQFYYGTVQPSSAAAQIAGSLFYGMAQDDGFPQSSADILTTGNIGWSGPGGDGGGVATDQTGKGTLYQYKWPCCADPANDQLTLPPTDFFRVNNISRTFGLIQQSNPPPALVPDPQWPFLGTINFAVNPISGNQIIIGSAAGRIFGTSNQGQIWNEIGKPTALDGTQSLAMAFGSPQPDDPTGSLNNFLYVGTNGGHIFVTFTGGGANGDQWTDISTGLDGSAVQAIITNPRRGSREAYAVTFNGIYHMVDAKAPSASWINITGNIKQAMHSVFTPFNDQTQLVETQLGYLRSIAADWRYAVPDDPTEFNNPKNPPGSVHPALYVAGEGGVYRSTDNGVTWNAFPNVADDEARQDGGFLPNAQVSDLDTALGNINPTTGFPIVKDPITGAVGPDLLVATTFGRGTFAIRLAPVVVPGSTQLDPTLPGPAGSDSGVNKNDKLTNVLQPVIDGMSQISAFTNTVKLELLDLTGNPAVPPVIGMETIFGANFTNTTFDDTVTTPISQGVAPYTGSFQPDGKLGSLAGEAVTGGWQLQIQDTAGGNVGTLLGWSLNVTNNLGQKTTYPASGNQIGLPVPAQGTGGTGDPTKDITTSTLNINAGADTVSSLTVNLNISHTNNSDLVINLIAPDGKVVPLVGQRFTFTDQNGRFKILVQPGYFKADGSTDGIKVLGVRATDGAGVVGPISKFVFTLNTTPFVKSNTLMLAPDRPLPVNQGGSDSGLPNGLQNTFSDKITNVLRPFLLGAIDQAAPTEIDISDVTNPASPIALGSGMTDVNGNFAIQFNAGAYSGNGSMDGLRTLEIDAVHQPLGAPGTVGSFTFTLDTRPPATAPAPSLLSSPSNDTGRSQSDGITRQTLPSYVGTGEPRSLVRLYATRFTDAEFKIIDASFQNRQVGQDFVNTLGNYTVTVSGLTPLTQGFYRLSVDMIDLAGNVGAQSPVSAALVVRTTPPKVPTVVLDPAFRTNPANPNVTSAVPTQFNVTADPDTDVVILDSNTVIASFPPDHAATFNALLNLKDGPHVLTVQATDRAGNTSTSASVTITIDSQALDPDRKFIRQLYFDYLGRPGSLPEWNMWVPALQGTNGRFVVANAIGRASEARTFTVQNWYVQYLGRATRPSAGEVQVWVNAFLQGLTEEQVLSLILATGEYYNRAGVTFNQTPTDATFVQALYAQVLGRQATPSAGEINFWVGRVQQVGRQAVALAFLQSPEYRVNSVNGYYLNLLRRSTPPTQPEVAGWVNSGLDTTSIRIRFESSDEYYFRVTGFNR